MDKKAQLGNLQQIIITLVVVGIVLGIGFMILSELEESMGDTRGSVTEETQTFASTGVYVDYNSTTDGVWCYNDFSVTNITNNLDGTTVPTDNYTYVTATGLVIPEANSIYIDNEINLSYSYDYSTSAACEGVGETVDAMEKVPSWLSIIVILFIVGILLAILFNVLPTEGEGIGGIGGFGDRGSSGTIAEI